MPRGANPKIYPTELVDRVRVLYAAGHTQDEVAELLGTTQKVIYRLMRRHGIAARTAAKRCQRGPWNHAWKGEDAGYSACHLRVQSERGRPSKCETCGTTTAPRYEWANLTGRYADPLDYKRLCVPCHHKLDGHVLNLGEYACRKEVLP